MKITNKKIFLLPLLIHAIFYWSTTGSQPMLGDESLMALLDRPPQIAKQLTDGEVELFEFPAAKGLVENPFPPLVTLNLSNWRLPLLFQHRQGGLFFIPLKILGKLVDPLLAWRVYHYSLTLISLLLLTGFIYRLFSSELAFLVLGLCCLDPLWTSYFSIDVTEQFILPLILMALFILRVESPGRVFAGAFVLGLGFGNKVTFVFYAVALTLLFWRQALALFRNKLFWPGLILGCLPFLSLFELSKLWGETREINSMFSWTAWLRDSWNVLVQKRAYLDLFQDINYLHAIKLKTWKWQLQFHHLLFFALYLYPLFGKNAVKKSYLKCGAVFLLWTLMYQLVVRTEVYLPEYYFGALPLLAYMLATSLNLLRQRYFEKLGAFRYWGIVVVTAVLPLLIENLTWVRDYRKTGPVTYNHAVLAHSIASELRTDNAEWPLYCMSEEDPGRFEWLSKEQFRPIHLFDLIAKLRWKSFTEMLLELKRGQMLVSLTDQNTSWYGLWGGPIDSGELKREAASLGLLISHEKFFPEKTKAKAYSFRFQKIAN